jgi:hypothetical protein
MICSGSSEKKTTKEKVMKLSPREVAMGLATQAELLPKLRDNLLEIVNQINMALNESRNPKAPRSPFMGTGKTSKADAGRMGGLKAQAKRRKKIQPKAKFLDELPVGALNVQGIHHSYFFAPGVGMLSLVKDGRVRLLITPGQKSSWTVKDLKGERLFIGRAKLQERVGRELGL